MVDVGGGTGHIMMAVLRRFGNLKVIVQDVESAVNVGRRVCPYTPVFVGIKGTGLIVGLEGRVS